MNRLLVLCLVLGVTGCGKPARPIVHVFAAASTKEALEQAARDFEAKTGTPVSCSFAGSSDLARQIEQGADADLFLSADERWADYLAERNLVEARRDLLGNRLVVIAPADHPLMLHDLKDLAGGEVEHLALALEPVPAGRYARQALRKAGVWEQVRGRVRELGDVRAVLACVGRDEVEAGIVYATDAAASERVRVALKIPDDLHEPIRYPLALVRRREKQASARALYDYLGSEAAAACFRRAGFSVYLTR
jgi:molybdate transport system substrate-binding protein